MTLVPLGTKYSALFHLSIICFLKVRWNSHYSHFLVCEIFYSCSFQLSKAQYISRLSQKLLWTSFSRKRESLIDWIWDSCFRRNDAKNL